MIQYPIFIICRDRVSCLIQLVDWLERAGHERIIFVDNDSTYEPLLEYYEQTPYTVLRGNNDGHQSPWHRRLTPQDEYFVVTDPDVVPTGDCPLDAVDYFRSLLDRYEDKRKAGFSLKINDLPEHYKFRDQVMRHESQYFHWLGPEERILFAPIDTTFALYRPGASPEIGDSIRTLAPYEARHLPWYIDSMHIDEEEKHYRANMLHTVNSWNKDEPPGWIR